MKSIAKILRKNHRQNLGRHNKELVIRLALKKNCTAKPMYHLVLARKRSKALARYDKLGFYEVYKQKNKFFYLLGIDRSKFKQAFLLGASIHLSVYKILI